jgi:hypothetical protein
MLDRGRTRRRGEGTERNKVRYPCRQGADEPASLDPEKVVTILTLMHEISRAGGMAVLCSSRASPTGALVMNSGRLTSRSVENTPGNRAWPSSLVLCGCTSL